MRKRHPDNVLDCEECMGRATVEQRQEMGCGWLPRLDSARPPMPEGMTGPDLSVCYGYAIRLPQVREAVRAHVHCGWGTLTARCNGELPAPPLLDALEVLQRSQWEVEAAAMEDRNGNH